MAKTQLRKDYPKTQREPKVKSRKLAGAGHGIINLLLLFVVISIACSSYIVFVGTTGLEPKLLILPQTVFAGIVLIRQFTK